MNGYVKPGVYVKEIDLSTFFRKEGIMGKEYRQLKEIKLQDVLDLEDNFFRKECLARLIDCGFIEEKPEQWEQITLKDLHRIRPGVTLKRVFQPREEIVHVVSDPYWTSWGTRSDLQHILVFNEKLSVLGIRAREKERGVNDLFNGEVYIQV